MRKGLGVRVDVQERVRVAEPEVRKHRELSPARQEADEPALEPAAPRRLGATRERDPDEPDAQGETHRAPGDSERPGRACHQRGKHQLLSAEEQERAQAAGWPWRIAPPGLPRIRTCRFPASGSSGHGFTALDQIACEMTGRGSGYASNSTFIACIPPLVLERRDNHLHHSTRTQYRNESSAK